MENKLVIQVRFRFPVNTYPGSVFVWTNLPYFEHTCSSAEEAWAFCLEFLRLNSAVEEVRWNAKGSLQGFYVTRSPAA